MLIERDFPRPTPITFAARELIAELKSGPMVLVWYDPKRGPQTIPIGDARRLSVILARLLDDIGKLFERDFQHEAPLDPETQTAHAAVIARK